ncbi:hypothetical protein ACLBX9_15945 [Methylobacterium sp. A49B]
MKIRSRPEAKVLRASVSLMWLGGKTHTEIAASCGISRAYVGYIVHHLRAAGMDLPRRKPGRRPGTRVASCRATVRATPRPPLTPFSPDRDDILDAWADGVQARDLALLTRRSVGSVKQIIHRARLMSDPRAIPHSRWPAA